MTAYAVYDAEGRIIQSNKVFDPDVNYDRRYQELGHKFVRNPKQGTLFSMETTWVDPKRCFPRNRPLMPITFTKERIEAGGNDSVVFHNIPMNARLQVFHSIPGVGTINPHDLIMPTKDREFEYGVDVPCLFTVKFTKWPYQDWSQQFEAVAA